MRFGATRYQSHLTKSAIMDYERKSEPTSIASANAAVASKDNIPLSTLLVGKLAFLTHVGQCTTNAILLEIKTRLLTRPQLGFELNLQWSLQLEATRGSTSVAVSPNGQVLTINAEASGHICHRARGAYLPSAYQDACIGCPDAIQQWAGYARRQVQVNLISTTPNRQIGEQEVLMITTRGLCCCASTDEHEKWNERVVGFQAIPSHLVAELIADADFAMATYASYDRPMAAEFKLEHRHAHAGELCPGCAENAKSFGGPIASPPGCTNMTSRATRRASSGPTAARSFMSMTPPMPIPACAARDDAAS